MQVVLWDEQNCVHHCLQQLEMNLLFAETVKTGLTMVYGCASLMAIGRHHHILCAHNLYYLRLCIMHAQPLFLQTISHIQCSLVLWT